MLLSIHPFYYPLLSFVIFAFSCLHILYGEYILGFLLSLLFLYVDYKSIQFYNTYSTQKQIIITLATLVKFLLIANISFQKYIK